MEKKRVTGVGGVFFKCEDPNAVKDWYKKHLGFNTDQWGTTFEFKKVENPSESGYLQWSPFAKNTEYFQPSEKAFMINYRVEDIEWLVTKLKEEGVTVLDDIETYPYGKFIHILDPEGNKIELWEPIDAELHPK